MKSESSVRLERYEQLVRAWAPKLDLVAPGDLERIRERHIDDSLRLTPLLADLPPGPCVDVGSGAGFPGVPLAIVTGRTWRLVEPRRRRAAFLDEVVRELDLDCQVVTRRVEELHRDPVWSGAHVLATARALAPPSAALALIAPLVAPRGVGAVFIGSGASVPGGSRLWQPGIAIFEAGAASEGD